MKNEMLKKLNSKALKKLYKHIQQNEKFSISKLYTLQRINLILINRNDLYI
jgi:uncharacterized protein YfkK (UPF0435 family)